MRCARALVLESRVMERRLVRIPLTYRRTGPSAACSALIVHRGRAGVACFGPWMALGTGVQGRRGRNGLMSPPVRGLRLTTWSSVLESERQPCGTQADQHYCPARPLALGCGDTPACFFNTMGRPEKRSHGPMTFNSVHRFQGHPRPFGPGSHLDARWRRGLRWALIGDEMGLGMGSLSGLQWCLPASRAGMWTRSTGSLPRVGPWGISQFPIPRGGPVQFPDPSIGHPWR